MKTVATTTLNDAITNLAEARDQLPADASTQEILESLEDEVTAVSEAADSAKSELKCVD